MEKVNFATVILLLVMTGCGENKKAADDLITVDVTNSYPKKELILQDFMDVEYVLPETGSEFYTEGVVQAVGKDIIIAKNERVRDGDLFVFDRNGKGLRKINHKGSGPGEYADMDKIILDDDKNEIYVVDITKLKLLVYDYYGTFKRTVDLKSMYRTITVFDQENLIYEILDLSNNPDLPAFSIISKQDGNVVHDIRIPYNEKRDPIVYRGRGGMMHKFPALIPYNENFILTYSSSDTVFNLLSDYSMIPLMVRTPSIQSMSLEVFLFPRMITDSYYFMDAVKKTYDFELNEGFPKVDLMYDRRAKAIYEYKLYNDDYTGKKPIDLSKGETISGEIAILFKIEAHELIESNEKGELKGKLKEIASKLDEDSNPVIMLVKQKK